MTIGKNARVFQTNITNKTPINADTKNLGWFQILAELAVTFFLVE